MFIIIINDSSLILLLLLLLLLIILIIIVPCRSKQQFSSNSVTMFSCTVYRDENEPVERLSHALLLEKFYVIPLRLD